MPNTTPWWGRISLLWLMVAPLCVVIYNLCVPIAANDFWYHARAGSLTATTGHIPTTNTFSAGLAADWPYFYQNWLAELIMYKVLQHGGLAWIVMLRSLCMGLTYVVLVVAIYRRCCRVAGAHL